MTDTRVATRIWGAAIINMDTGIIALATDHPGYPPLASAWAALNSDEVQDLAVANEWTVDTLRRLSTVNPAILDAAFDYQKLARALEPQFKNQHSLAACAKRLGMSRIPYGGNTVWTQKAMDAVNQDARILLAMHRYYSDMQGLNVECEGED